MEFSQNYTERSCAALYAFATRFHQTSFDEICKHLRVTRVPVKLPDGVHASLGKLDDQWLVQYALSATDEPTMQFLVFHEIGHIILCPADTSPLDPVSMEEEALCDRFAALMVMAQHADDPFSDKTIQKLLTRAWTEASEQARRSHGPRTETILERIRAAHL
jgi:Zn-dependent peptidase ImmA (M78 family)